MTETIKPSTSPAEAAPRKIRWTMVALWAAVLFIIGILAWGLINTTAARPEVGQTAPDFDVEFFDGYEWESKPVSSLAEMRGRPVVLNFWASWCVECRYETDVLEAAWQKYRDQGVVFLGVAYADVEPNSIAYMEEFGVTFPHAPDLGTDISQDYEITGVPETFFIDKDGVIRHVQIGAVNQQMLDTLILDMLAE
jgi:cytochrome c biogenesis protein CcmG/thiol:disulfide interchange protein DsbE